MGRKAEVVRLIARNAEKLSARPGKTDEELLGLGMQMPVSWMKSPEHISQYIDQNGLNFVQAADFAGWVLTLSPFVDKVDVDDKITFSELKQADERVRTQFIAVNRINYILHDAMLDVYDLLEREKRMKFAVRKCRGKAEDCWGEHFAARRKQTKETALYTVQDVLDLYCVRLKPYLEKVYESIRDYMIRQGLGDVELRARCAVVMFMGKVAGTSFRHYFDDIRRETGADFSRMFASDDLHAMVGWFARMCEALGIKTSVDGYGFYTLDGFSIEASQRVKWAVSDFMRMSRDEDVMDETAMRALELNPKVMKDYEEAIAEGEREREEQKRREMEEGFRALAEKYNTKTFK